MVKSPKRRSPSKRRSSPKRRSPSPKRRSSPKKSPKRRSPKRPSTPAKELAAGQRKKGKDGHMYIVRIRSNGVRYWQKCGKKSGKKSGSHCRFVGPAQSPKRRSPKK